MYPQWTEDTTTVYLAPDADEETITAALDCPCFAERTARVNRAWQEHVNLMRFAFSTYNSHDPDARELWQLWQVSPEVMRERLADVPVHALARNRDGLADEPFGVRGSNYLFDLSLFAQAPYLRTVLSGNGCYSPTEAQLLADHLYGVFAEVMGEKVVCAVLDRRLEGQLRAEAVQRAIVQGDLYELAGGQEEGPSYDLLTTTVLAGSFIRWVRFWAAKGIGICPFEEAF